MKAVIHKLSPMWQPDITLMLLVLVLLQLELLQSRLLDVGSAVATPLDSSAQHKINRVSFASSNTDTLEVRMVHCTRSELKDVCLVTCAAACCTCWHRD